MQILEKINLYLIECIKHLKHACYLVGNGDVVEGDEHVYE